MPKKHINIFVNSNPTSGSINLSSDKSSFVVPLLPPLRIPSNARDIHVCLVNANIFYTFQNIKSNNNKIYYTNDLSNPTKYYVEFLEGLYSLDLLNETLQNLLVNNDIAHKNIFEFIADEASGRVLVKFNTTGYQVYFPSDTMYSLLGINLNTKFPTSTLSVEAKSYYAQNVANFGSVSSILFRTSLSNEFIYNQKSSDVLANINIDVSPGSIINYQPNNLVYVHSENLAGQTINSIQIRITDQNENPLNTNNEYYTGLIELSYEY